MADTEKPKVTRKIGGDPPKPSRVLGLSGMLRNPNQHIEAASRKRRMPDVVSRHLMGKLSRTPQARRRRADELEMQTETRTRRSLQRMVRPQSRHITNSL